MIKINLIYYFDIIHLIYLTVFEMTLPYQHIDNILINCPIFGSLNEATTFIRSKFPPNSPSKNLVISRLVYKWIGENIEYDVERFLRKEFRDDKEEDILITRKGICDHYARLFQRLCVECGMSPDDVMIIYGWGKMFDVNPGEPNHGWNAIRLFQGGKWYLVDSCWGAGYCDIEGKNVYEESIG